MADWLSGLVSGVSSLVGGVGSASWNMKMQRDSQRWQTSEREASQLYQTSEREAQNKFSEDMYNKYSSPAAIAAQYSAAGLNPRLAVDGGSVGEVAASSGSSGGAPSGQSTVNPYVDSGAFSNGFLDMANGLKAFAEAKKAGADAETTDALRDAYVREAGANADNAEILAHVNWKFLSKERRAALDKVLADTDRTREDIENLRKQGVLLGKDIDWYDKRAGAEIENLLADTNVKNQTVEFLKSQTRLSDKQLDEVSARIENLVSQAIRNYAEAKHINLSSSMIQQTAPFVVEEYMNRLRDMDDQHIMNLLEQDERLMKNRHLFYYGKEQVGDGAIADIGSAIEFRMAREGKGDYRYSDGNGNNKLNNRY